MSKKNSFDTTDVTLAELIQADATLHAALEIEDLINNFITTPQIVAPMLNEIHAAMNPMFDALNKVNEQKLAHIDLMNQIAKSKPTFDAIDRVNMQKLTHINTMNLISKVGSPTLFAPKQVTPEPTQNQNAASPAFRKSA